MKLIVTIGFLALGMIGAGIYMQQHQAQQRAEREADLTDSESLLAIEQTFPGYWSWPATEPDRDRLSDYTLATHTKLDLLQAHSHGAVRQRARRLADLMLKLSGSLLDNKRDDTVIEALNDADRDRYEIRSKLLADKH